MTYLKLLPVLFLFCFISCSDDSSNIITPPANDTLFTLDSLTAWIGAGGTGIQNTSYSFGQTVTANKVRLEFTIQSNADSIHAVGWYSDSTNGTPALPSPQFVYSPVDSLYTYNIDVASQPFYLSFDIMLTVSIPGTVPYYIRFKSIRAVKTS